MFQVGVPEGAEPGATIQVQSPWGNTLQVQVPEGSFPGSVFQVQDPNAPVQATVIGAPQQMSMNPGSDIFNNATRVMVKQEWAAIELCGIEAKNRYRISVPTPDNQEGPAFLYITEESQCFERVCCGPNRSLTLKVHMGASKEGPVVQHMHKPLSCQGCCFLRPSFSVTGASAAEPLGNIDDPCRCCLMDQQVFNASQQPVFTTQGSICQGGIFCPLCFDVDFSVKKGDAQVAKISKMALSCEEACVKTNRFMVEFGQITDAQEKKLLLASAMLLDLEYFEQQKNNN